MSAIKISPDLRKRILFLLGAMIVYRIGSHIPVPGIDVALLQQSFESQKGGILGMLDVFSGGALGRVSLFALGVMPYITASIIMQLMAVALPSLAALKKEGSVGQRKITQYTRYLTVFLAVFQSYGISVAIEQQDFVLHPGMSFRLIMTLSLTTGTMFLMWLGEQITERGVGNGISILIFSGIAAGLPTAVVSFLELVRNSSLPPLPALLIIVVMALAIVVVIFFERAQRRVPVNYPRQQAGMGRQSSHLPLKINVSGVIPPIFASSIILFPTTILSWSQSSTAQGGMGEVIRNIASNLSPGSGLYVILYAVMIVFFTFFYTSVAFNTKEVSENLKRGGGLIPGIRPGEQTAKYLDTLVLRLTVVGATYITVICVLPEILRMAMPQLPFYFGGTSLLILVVVALDFQEQMSGHIMSQRYESLLKKTRFKRHGAK
jgi:preprotein translocase subunit SecY